MSSARDPYSSISSSGATTTKMKLRFIFEDDNEFATFELRRLSYDVGTGIEIKSSDEDADDLLLLSLTNDLSPDGSPAWLGR
jgi:hypothetical protein